MKFEILEDNNKNLQRCFIWNTKVDIHSARTVFVPTNQHFTFSYSNHPSARTTTAAENVHYVGRSMYKVHGFYAFNEREIRDDFQQGWISWPAFSTTACAKEKLVSSRGQSFCHDERHFLKGITRSIVVFDYLTMGLPSELRTNNGRHGVHSMIWIIEKIKGCNVGGSVARILFVVHGRFIDSRYQATQHECLSLCSYSRQILSLGYPWSSMTMRGRIFPIVQILLRQGRRWWCQEGCFTGDKLFLETVLAKEPPS
jgi:hypothetical protein